MAPQIAMYSSCYERKTTGEARCRWRAGADAAGTGLMASGAAGRAR